MGIKYYNGGLVRTGQYIVWADGVIDHRERVASFNSGRIACITDTAEEAERMRLLIEKRREEVEVVERKYELLIAAEVTV